MKARTIFVTLACVATAVPAVSWADVLWSDFQEVSQKFNFTAAQILPKKCLKNDPEFPEINPISFAETDGNEVTFEARLNLTPPCRSMLLKGLNKRVVQEQPVISYAKARAVEYYNTHGDGPTIMVRLIADERMLREVNRTR